MSPHISTRTARTLLGYLQNPRDFKDAWWTDVRLRRATAELERALSKRLTRKPIKAKRKKVGHGRGEVYAAVTLRADGICECGCGRPFETFAPGQGDHFFGRARAESVETVWMLRADCHQMKTNNNPSAAWWWGTFVAHCDGRGYHAEAKRARARLHGMLAVRKSESARRAEGR